MRSTIQWFAGHRVAAGADCDDPVRAFGKGGAQRVEPPFVVFRFMRFEEDAG